MVKMLEKGADAIQIVACPEEACRFLVGSSKAERRVEYVRQLLDEIDFGAERVGLVRGMNLSAEQLLDWAKERAELIRELGPNPMRDEGNGGSPESPPRPPSVLSPISTRPSGDFPEEEGKLCKRISGKGH